MATGDETIELTPLLPMWRSLRIGFVIGAVVGAGFVIWRVTEDGSGGWATVAFVVTALAFGAWMGWYTRRSIARWIRAAEPVPDGAQVMSRRSVTAWAIFAGAGFGVAIIGRAAGDSPILAAALVGVEAGGLVGASMAVARLARWQAEHGKELLQWRRGGFRNPRHYVRTA